MQESCPETVHSISQELPELNNLEQVVVTQKTVGGGGGGGAEHPLVQVTDIPCHAPYEDVVTPF